MKNLEASQTIHINEIRLQETTATKEKIYEITEIKRSVRNKKFKKTKAKLNNLEHGWVLFFVLWNSNPDILKKKDT